MSRRWGVVIAVLGVVFLAGALVWSTVAVPMLVKFPLNTDITLHYSGNLVTYVDAKTAAPLPVPSSVPLTIDRTIKAIAADSSSTVAVVSEHLVLKYPGNNVVENNRYTFNRRTMAAVPSSKAYTFRPAIPGASAGSYYVTLPMNIVPGTTRMSIWKPETATTYPLLPDPKSGRPASLDGMAVSWFDGKLPMTPVASYERSALAARGFPMSLSSSQVIAQMSEAGVSVSTLSTALLPVLPIGEARQLVAVLSKPLQLRYFSFGSGLVGAQTRSGAMIDLYHIVDGIAVAPAPNGLDQLVSILSRHENVTGVPQALTVIRHMLVTPTPVYELQYSQTPSSILDMVSTTDNQLGQISVAEDWIPVGAAAIGAVLVLSGALILWRRRTPPTAGVTTAGSGKRAGTAGETRAEPGTAA